MKKYIALILCILFISNIKAQEISFFVESGERNYLDCPVSFRLNADIYTGNDDVVLYDVSNQKQEIVKLQEDPDQTGLFWFVIEGELRKNTRKDYLLVFEEKEKESSRFAIDIDHEKLEVILGGDKVLRYRIAEKYPPEGIDPIYKRSAYIHPLWSPGGEILTNIQPESHLHHYGLWSPWTKTHIKDREIDYWNLGKGEGTVKFAGMINSFSGKLFAGFSTLHEHIDFGAKGPDRVSMLETWKIRSWDSFHNRSQRMIDYYSNIYNNIEDTIIFNAYRYGGGLAFRANPKWNKETCTVLTSEGKTRENADGERARWCIVEGISSVKEGRSGILFLSHPFNYDHPEALRVWPKDAAGGTGELMFDYCPARLNDWIIKPGRNYRLNYRMVVYDGEMTAEEAEMYWNAFAFPPEVNFEE